MNTTKIKLTERGKLVAARMREERQENIERNNGVYVEEPWYKRYLSPNFVIPEQSTGVSENYSDKTLLDDIIDDEENEDDDIGEDADNED